MSVELHMLPIKAGDATLLIERGAGRPTTVLIDAGLDPGGVRGYLHQVQVNHLDLVILSHPDLDHIQGLLALLQDHSVSIGTIWCFDLAFLRDFVTTGRLPQPRAGTHPIEYVRLLWCLVGHDQILKAATLRGIRCLQVSEGYRTNVGRLHLEVLYPSDEFYDRLRDPRALKKLLAKKWPQDWWPPGSPEFSEREPRHTRPVRLREQQRSRLEDLLREMQADEDDVESVPLAGSGFDEHEIEIESEEFPLSLLGTLYNNLSIVVRVFVTGGIKPPRLLFPGDLTDWTYLVACRWDDLRAEVFKYPHHGSEKAGVSRTVLEKVWWLYCRPWRWYRCKEWWRRLCRVSDASNSLFSELVAPAHTLVFPYPQKQLPRSSASLRNLGQLHANRKYQALGRLAGRGNPPTARILKIGDEQHQIAVV